MPIALDWDSPEYRRIASVTYTGDRLIVQFEDGTSAMVEAQRVVPPFVHDVDWNTLDWNSHEITVSGSEGPVEIPWSTIRALSDKRYAAHLAEVAEEQARQIGLRIRELRESRGMTSKALAERAGITPQSLSRIELGRHDVVFTTLQRILAAMGYALKDLAMPPSPPKTLHHLLKRLSAAGIDREFALRRLVPKDDRSLLMDGTDTNGDAVQTVALSTSRIFDWSVPTLLGSESLQLNVNALPLPLFKVRGRANVARVKTYTFYAHCRTCTLIRATPNMISRPVPPDADTLRRDVIDKYGVINFEALLRYSWDLGIAVIPLRDPGGFYGACWRIEDRNVIVLKQVTDAQARWAIDLAHELKHVASHLSNERPALIDSEEITLAADSGEEEEASDFASNLLLFGRAEELAQACVEQAGGSVERLKQVVQRVASAEHVPVDALANYMAFRLGLQNINWWGAAQKLQITDPSPIKIAREILLDHVQMDRLGQLDRGLLLSALSEPEGSVADA